MEKERYLVEEIGEDLKEKMVFIGGARQVGKTTLARNLISKKFTNSYYYNWDHRPDRKQIMKFELPGRSGLIILDEIHKYKKWKNIVKGIFDTYKDKFKILVTGSARMNVYRKGGDSLQGRYHYYTLHPFSVAELHMIKNKFIPFKELEIRSGKYFESIELLYRFGGFPEVLIKQSTKTLRRWHNQKLERLFREDIRNTETVRDINSMILLGDLLPSKAANPLSINAIREDLEVSHRAITNWLSILELFYYHFRVYPYHSKLNRSIKKEAKLYLTDWSEVKDEGARFENLVASHLMKFVQYINECEGYKIKLNYLRNVDKKEVDFLISIDNKPWFAVEVKLNETSPSPNLFYYKERLKIPYLYQVIKKKDIDILREGIRVISADNFLASLV